MHIKLSKMALNGILLLIVVLSQVAAGPTLKTFRIPTDNSQPRDITLGADGNMWFTESELNVSQIGRVDAKGNITEFVVPTRFSQPSEIIAGPDGALWFTEPSGFPNGMPLCGVASWFQNVRSPSGRRIREPIQSVLRRQCRAE